MEISVQLLWIRIYTCKHLCVHMMRCGVLFSLVTNQLNNVLPVMFGWKIMANNNTKNCYENGALSTRMNELIEAHIIKANIHTHARTLNCIPFRFWIGKSVHPTTPVTNAYNMYLLYSTIIHQPRDIFGIIISNNYYQYYQCESCWKCNKC